MTRQSEIVLFQLAIEAMELSVSIQRIHVGLQEGNSEITVVLRVTYIEWCIVDDTKDFALGGLYLTVSSFAHMCKGRVAVCHHGPDDSFVQANAVTSLYRIVGGNEARIEDFPYQLSLRRGGVHICGAVLISQRFALSAAHCFSKRDLYFVKAGSDNKDEGGIVVALKTAILHPERTHHIYEYDIAILEFEVALQLTDKIKPIKLADNDQVLKPGISGIISGFGDVYQSENRGSKHLRAVRVEIRDQDYCQAHYESYGIELSDQMFCAGAPKGGKDSCQGDSGGPFVIDNVLYGLVSYGINCGDQKFPGVYTNIVKFRDFIRLNSGV